MRLALLAACALLAAGPLRAQPAGEGGVLCRAAIRQAETAGSLPATLLAGIARVESGRRDPGSGRVSPWPWTINAEGRGRFFDSKADAVAAARELRARGVLSFDVGCLQVNLMHHADAFASLEDAFDPLANARYAVRFLQSLRDRLGNWEDASAWYHSANPEHGVPYRARVVAAMAEEAKEPAAPAVAMAAAGTAPMPVFSSPAALGGAFSRPGNLVMLPRAGGMVAAGGQGVAGRGLDAYRAQPVPIAGVRFALAR